MPYFKKIIIFSFQLYYLLTLNQPIIKKPFNLLLLFFVFTTAFLSGCSEEIYDEHVTQDNIIEEINLEQFLRESRIQNFNKQIKVRSSSIRDTDRSYSLTDFIINTEVIRRYVYDEKITYTFRIFPIEEIEDKYFNIIYYFDNGWKTKILEYTPTDENLILLKNNSTNLFEGDVKQVFQTAIPEPEEESCYFWILSTFATSTAGHEKPVEIEVEICFDDVVYIDAGSSPGGSDSGSGSGGPNDGTTVSEPVTDNQIATSPIFESPGIYNSDFEDQLNQAQFQNNLSSAQQQWAAQNATAYNQLIQYLIDTNQGNNQWSDESKEFGEELIELSRQDELFDSNTYNFVLQAKINNQFEHELDLVFLASVDEYVNIATIDPVLAAKLAKHFTIQCAIKRHQLSQEPGWNDLYDWQKKLKVFHAATQEIVHISLDIFGLVPLFGEPADVLNGVLYTIEGDGVNATLSFASTIPLLGWASTSTKYGLKVINSLGGSTELVWKFVGDVIDFGDRGQLRKVLGLLPGNSLQAHHLIPWTSQTKMAIQRAAKHSGAFHMNEVLNGIPIAVWRNTNHTTYNNVINGKLDDFRDEFPNATPEHCYLFLTNLIENIRTWVISHPNSHLNDIVLP